MAEHTAVPCRNCQYDLTGLPRKGRCPECGNPYDRKTGLGIAAGPAESLRRGDRIMARARTILLALSIVMVLGCGGLLSWVYHLSGGYWLKPLAMAGVLSAVLLMATVLSYLNERDI